MLVFGSPTGSTSSETEDPGLKLAVFSTGPAIRNTFWNLITEIIGTFVLVLGVLAITDPATRASPSAGSARCSSRFLVVGHRPVARWPDRLRDQPGA